jgi:hypothetical protein
MAKIQVILFLLLTTYKKNMLKHNYLISFIVVDYNSLKNVFQKFKNLSLYFLLFKI